MARSKTYRNTKWYLLIFASFFSLAVFAQLKKAPEWVSQVPITENAFFGLGIAEIKENSEYRTQARKMALREIIEKIQLSINSKSELNVDYDDKQVQYRLNEKIAVESSGFLSGHQKVDEWIDKKAKKYYVLFRLNESTYRENRYDYFQQLSEIIYFIRSEADELFTKGEIIRGIKKLSDGIIRLDDEMKELVEPEYLVSLQKSRLSALYELEEQLSRIKFQTRLSYDFEAVEAKPLIISNFLVDLITGTPIRNLETKLKVLDGDVFNHEFLTRNGQSDLHIYGVYPTDQTSAIQLVPQIPIPTRVKNSIDPNILKRLISSRITMRFLPYSISFHSNENDKGALTELLKSVTTDLRLDEKPDLEADYKIVVDTENKIIHEQRGIYTAQYQAKVTIIRLIDDQEVYEYEFPAQRVKARRKSVALTNTENQALSESRRFLQSFVTFLCSKPIDLVD
ncbi:MAG: LPP20 family lipoprotein [Bacteroidota bacterium]